MAVDVVTLTGLEIVGACFFGAAALAYFVIVGRYRLWRQKNPKREKAGPEGPAAH